MSDVLEEIKNNVSNPYFLVLMLILGVAAFFRLKYAFFDGMWVDEARHARIVAEVAKHPLSYQVSEAWRGMITEIPPVYPYLMIISSYIFGSSEFAIRIVSPIAGVTGIGLTYLLGKEMKNKEVGLLAAALLVFNGTYWFLSERILIGATFAALYTATMIALYYGLDEKEYSKYALWAVGPLTALNILTKQPAYTLGLVILVYFVYKRWDDIQGLKDNLNAEYLRRNFSNLGIAIGLGTLTLLPWSIRSQSVCGVPLCGLKRAADFATKGGSLNDAVFSVQGPMYFIQTLPQILTIPVALLLGLMVVNYFFEVGDENADLLVKYVLLVIIGVGIGYMFKAALIPLVLISSMALLAKTDAEKLLWIWAGIGIGFMSIPSIKVPRYIVFVIPALMILASISVFRISAWLDKITENNLNKSLIVLAFIAGLSAILTFSLNLIPVTVLGTILAISGIAVLVTKKFEGQYLKFTTLMLIIALPMIFVSYASGVQNAQSGGYPAVKEAGEWLNQNTAEDSKILGTSFRQVMYQAYPRIAWMPHKNESQIKKQIKDKNISYVVIGTYEKAQPRYTQLKIPPHRVPNKMRRKLSQRQISGQKVVSQFGKTPKFLIPLKRFGKARVVPFRQITEPRVIVYQVNRTALK